MSNQVIYNQLQNQIMGQGSNQAQGQQNCIPSVQGGIFGQGTWQQQGVGGYAQQTSPDVWEAVKKYMGYTGLTSESDDAIINEVIRRGLVNVEAFKQLVDQEKVNKMEMEIGKLQSEIQILKGKIYG